MEHHHIARGTPFRQNSPVFKINDAFTYFTMFWKKTPGIPAGSGYFSFHWLMTGEGGLQEITRDYFYLDKITPLCFFWSNPPTGATHLMFGIRINCEEANVSPHPIDVSFQNIAVCRPIGSPRMFHRAYRIFRDYYRLTPISLNIELVSFCNLRCIWCILDHTKAKKTMDFELYQQIIEQIVKCRKKIRRIDLHNGGEALLHPRFKDLIAFIGKARAETPDFPYTALLTNATKLTPEYSQAIIDSGALDLIRFSVDGGTPQEYEKIRRGADFHRTYTNIKDFLERSGLQGGKILTGIICIVDEGYPLSTEWMDPLFKELLSGVDLVELRRPHNFDGSVRMGVESREKRHGVCQFIKNNNIVILPDGNITLCCVDLNGRGVIRSICNSPLAGSATCTERRTVIQAMEKNERKTLNLCRNCDLY